MWRVWVVRIRGRYTSGHTYERLALLSPAGRSLDDWWQDVVFPHTGDGITDAEIGSAHTATIVDAPGRDYLSGATYVWAD